VGELPVSRENAITDIDTQPPILALIAGHRAEISMVKDGAKKKGPASKLTGPR
jgi:hypothetical protein